MEEEECHFPMDLHIVERLSRPPPTKAPTEEHSVYSIHVLIHTSATSIGSRMWRAHRTRQANNTTTPRSTKSSPRGLDDVLDGIETSLVPNSPNPHTACPSHLLQHSPTFVV